MMGHELVFNYFGLLEDGFRELALFAAVGYLIGGIDDILIDAIWLFRSGLRRLASPPNPNPLTSDGLPQRADPGRFAVFVPAWDESAVIGPMLDNALCAYANDQVHIFVGCYPNDPLTIEMVRRRAGPRLSLIVHERDGKTTKANCLNMLFAALQLHEAATSRRFSGIVLHDAEDVVSPHEMRVFDMMVDRFGMIQLPVVPLPDAKSRWIGGHYCDEFAESHGKTQIVRQALGAALPGAGVGCMIRRDVVEALALETGGQPFAEASLTEDYELGLRLGELGFKSAFVRVGDRKRFGVVATQAHFPATLGAAVQQKARWTIGIGLAGWDRLGWGHGWAENWMRLRDRKGVLAAVVAVAGYLAATLGCLLLLAQYLIGTPPLLFGEPLGILIWVNGLMLLWRLGVRAGFVVSVYGWREGCWAIPRTVVSNVIAIMAARRAVFHYLSMRRSGRVEWDQTAHKFPDSVGQ